MPLYNEEWIDNICMQLTEAEGLFLKEQIILSCPNTMLSFILENDIVEVTEFETFADIEKIIHRFPDEIQKDYFLALQFSDFMFVVRTLYNIIISDGQNTQANDTFEQLKENMHEIANVDVDKIYNRLYIHKTDLKKFIHTIQECMNAGDIENMKKHIKAREVMLKGANRAKTAHPGEFNPNDWIGGGELDYRFNNAKTIVRDIFESEGKINVES